MFKPNHARGGRTGRAAVTPALAAAALLFGALACSSGRGTPAAAPTASATASAVPAVAATSLASATPAPAPTPAQGPPDAAAMAMALLVGDTGGPAADFKLVSYAPVDWPDSSLGCPEPGKSYAQVVTPGWKVLIDRRGEVYELHSDRDGGSIVNCTALNAEAGDAVNVAERAGLRGATAVTLLRREAATGEYKEIEQVTDAAEVAAFVRALDLPVLLAAVEECPAVFKVVFKTPGGPQEFEFICPDDFQVLRGAQNFWGGKQGQAPVEFGNVVGKYASRVPFPGLPGQ